MAINLFGWEFVRKEDKEKKLQSFAPAEQSDGAVLVAAGSGYGTYLDMDGTVRTEAELVTKYREMSLHPECDAAVDEIINESISVDEETIIDINLDNVPSLSEKMKKALTDEFHTCLKLLDFSHHAYDIYRRWYIDGRLYYHVLIDKKSPREGIQELRYVDPRKIRKIREVSKRRAENLTHPVDSILMKTINEYFIYNDKGFNYGNKVVGPSTTGLKIAKDSILHVVSGLTDNQGTMVLSYLHKAIKALNQLRTLEDALVIYRLSRAPERRIWYIDVGNLPKMKAEQYVRDIMVKHKNRLIYDASCLALDTKIPLLDGRTLQLKEMIEEYEVGKQNWVYSCDPKTGKFVPGPVSWAGVTRKNERVMKITLDNGESVTCTLDHKFPVWDKGFVEAKDLIVGESMIPLYRREKEISKGRSKYHQIYNNETKKWVFTHREVSKWKDEQNILNEWAYSPSYTNSLKKTIHHKDFDRYNNSPDNLIRMNNDDHLFYHSQMNDSEKGKMGSDALSEKLSSNSEFREAFSQKISAGWTDEMRAERGRQSLERNGIEHFKDMNKKANEIRWSDKEQKALFSKSQTIEYTNEILVVVKECAQEGFSTQKTIDTVNEKVNLSIWCVLNKNKVTKLRNVSELMFTYKDLLRIVIINGCKDWREYRNSFNLILGKYKSYKEAAIALGISENAVAQRISRPPKKMCYLPKKNHKITKIEYLDERMDVGTLTIDRTQIYNNPHTFGLSIGIYSRNSGEIRDDRKFMTMLEDYWLPRREGGKGTEVTTLPGGQTLGQMDDVLYFQKKFLNALNVPISRLNSDSLFSVGRATEITRDELKFAKFVIRLRFNFSKLFYELLKKQVVLKGIMSLEDYEAIQMDIKFDYAQDNYFTELKHAEIEQNRINLARGFQDMAGKYFPNIWIRKNVLQQTDADIKKFDEEMAAEAQTGDPRWINPMIVQNEQMANMASEQEMQTQQNMQQMYAQGQLPHQDQHPPPQGGPMMPPGQPPNGAAPNGAAGQAQLGGQPGDDKLRQTVKQFKDMGKNRSMQDESQFKSALQVLEKNKPKAGAR